VHWVGLFLLVFLTVCLGIVAGYQALSAVMAPDEARVRRRIAAEFGREPADNSPTRLFKNVNQLKLEAAPLPLDSAAEVPVLSAQPRGLHARLLSMLAQANVSLHPRQLFWIGAGVGFVLGAIATLLAGLIVGIAAALVGVASPWIHVRLKANARQEKYLTQLPNAFDLMARVIRAGQPVPQALQSVADAFEDPLAAEFANCQRQQTLGLRPEVTFQEMAQRSGILEMRIFAMAMLIQRQTGGNLSEILERLAGLVRARLRLRRHVRSLTAEGRLQGWTLIVLPFLVFAAMMVINRGYAEVLLDHGMLLGVTGLSMALGLWWIRRIVNFEF
jgi:tight adherence protein B